MRIVCLLAKYVRGVVGHTLLAASFPINLLDIFHTAVKAESFGEDVGARQEAALRSRPQAYENITNYKTQPIATELLVSH